MELTPTLDTVASACVRFEHAFTPVEGDEPALKQFKTPGYREY